MGDRLRAGIPSRSTQPCIPLGSLNRVPASAGVREGDVTSAGWQVTLCDPMWHVSSRSGVATLRTAIHLLLVTLQACVTCEGGSHVHLSTTCIGSMMKCSIRLLANHYCTRHSQHSFSVTDLQQSKKFS